jgi:uncharacterized protein DUF5317
MTLFALALLVVGVSVSGWQIVTQGGWGNVALPPLKFALLPLLGFGLQVLALRWAGGPERLVLFSLSQILLLTFFSANFKYAPLRLLCLGFLLNLLPIMFNGGYMPIMPEALARMYPGVDIQQWASGLIRAGSKDIVLPPEAAPFWFLGDVFVIGKPFVLPTAFSLGDVVILFGFGWTVQQFISNRGVSNGSYRIRTSGMRGGS